MSALLDRPVTKVYPGLCSGCPVGRGARVGGRGNIQAEFVIIGEAPGGQELHRGIPFIGPSGQVLEQSLPPDFDLDKSALIINAIQCCPPKSASQSKDKALKLHCVNQCRQGVQDVLWKHPRKVLLVMGNWAAVHLLGDPDFKITKRRGEVDLVLDPVRGTEVQVMYAMHPASLLHGRGSPAAFASDVQAAIGMAYGTEKIYGEGIVTLREQYVEPTFEVLTYWHQIWLFVLRIRAEAARLGRKVELAYDTETSSLDANNGYILGLGVYGEWDDNEAQIIPWDEMDDPMVAWAVNELLALDCVTLVWQNGKFDRRFLHMDPRVRFVPDVGDDTLLLSYALDEASKAHDLEEQAKNLLGAPNYKDVLKQWLPNKQSSYSLVPRPVLWDYLAKDVKNTFHIKQLTRAQVSEDPHLEKLYTLTLLPAQALLTDIELYGIETDPVFVAKTRKLLERAIQMTLRAITVLAQRPINPNSPQQIAAWLYDEIGLRIKGKRPASTDKDTMDMLPDHPATKLVKTYRRLTKMLSTYVAAIEKRRIGNRIYTTYKLHSTTTGRPASVEPNILNIPREARYRRMYCAKTGHVLLEADYNTAELRGLAVLSGDKELTAIFMDGKRNLHDEVSIRMYGEGFTEYQRIRAKAVNFGIPYGRSAYTLADEYGIPVREGQRMIDEWFGIFPGAHKFLMKCRAAPIQGKSLITVFGRKRRPGLVSRERIDALQNEFANFFFQSMFSNDLTMHSSLRMHPEIKALGGHLVNIPYDSTVLEVPDDPEIVREAARIQKYYMEHTPTLWITTPIRFVVDQKVGQHWGTMTKLEKWLS